MERKHIIGSVDAQAFRHRRKTNKVGTAVAAGLLRLGTFMMCPGDELAMFAAAGSNNLNHNNVNRDPIARVEPRVEVRRSDRIKFPIK